MGVQTAENERCDLGSGHVEHLESVALHGDVVPEPPRLLRRIRVAVHVHHEPEVVDSLPLGCARANEIRQPQRQHRLADAMRHRLAETEIGGVRQGRHQLRDPDALPLRLIRHS
jgi:hypothetical protein